MNYEKMTKVELIKTLKILRSKIDEATDSSLSPPEQNQQQRLLHELQVYQEELKAQNQELREVKHILEESHRRYVNLYDFSPVGYVTLNGKGCIHEINLTSIKMLGRERSRLLGFPFIRFVAKKPFNLL